MVKSFGPLLEIARIQNEINRLFENLFDLRSTKGASEASWLPSVDICECPEYVVMKIEVPGVLREHLKFFINGGNIIIEGQKKRVEEGGKKKFHLAERGFGQFRRVININTAVNTHKAEAILKDGVLKITFPKVSNLRGSQVEIPIREE